MNAAVDFVDANVAAGRGKKLAIINADDGSSYTYNDVLAQTNRTGNALTRLGVRREERVMLLLLDSPEFVFNFFGAIKIGAVPIPTNTLLTPADYEYMINDSRARVLVVSEALLPQVEPILADLRHLDHIIVAGRPGDGQLSYQELIDAEQAELAPVDLSKDDACFWLYSSGTTGFPKGAVHLHHDMQVAADLYARPTLDITDRDRTFSVAKLFFAYGLGNGLYFPFRVGATTVLHPGRPDPATVGDQRRGRPLRHFQSPAVRVGGGVFAGVAVRTVETALRRRDFGRDRLDRDPAHLHLQPKRPGQARLNG
jgi:benzoate-CoA ligase